VTRTAEQIRRADPIRKAGLAWISGPAPLSGGTMYLCYNGHGPNKELDYRIHSIPARGRHPQKWFWTCRTAELKQPVQAVRLMRDAKLACAKHFLQSSPPHDPHTEGF
jgi:hypothetical protein